ncbi:response regulator [Brevundimonas sp.]|uniref:response regulator transcription factor n=1 Tax=Brevundimonas sp. TaxID=1871086 RepID=UPI00289F6424|nr:response regulator [Brevundimonas sp.]
MIAVVDDDEMVRAGLSRLLRSLGFQVLVFDSAEAYLTGETQVVDCVISDMQMPGMNGLALQQRIATDRPELPIIFVTAFPDSLTRARALAAGASCYLEKPCSADDLSGCLEHALMI